MENETEKTESSWIAHVKRELRLGKVDSSLYGKLLPDAILELAEVFDRQNHSGMSASITSQIFCELVKWNPLSPLTNDPEEWNDVSAAFEKPYWQSRRKPSAFSNDGGITYRITEKDEIYTSADKKQDDGGE